METPNLHHRQTPPGLAHKVYFLSYGSANSFVERADPWLARFSKCLLTTATHKENHP